MSGRARTASATAAGIITMSSMFSPREKCSRRPEVSPAWWRLASSGPSAVMTDTASRPCGSWKNVNAARYTETFELVR